MKYQNVVVLTGAGISAESGIKTFRDNNGLWEDHKIEEVATVSAFHNNPELVQRFYNLRREQLLSSSVRENKAHIALAEFENEFDGNLLIVTQNVDDLHERAGSKNIIHMHGELLKVRCTNCSTVTDWRENIESDSQCPNCQQHDYLRPHIVWFGEMPLQMETIEQRLSQCDLFISIGTSGNVYPAAGFVEIAQRHGAHTVEINLEPSKGESYFQEHIYGKASQLVPDYFDKLLTVTA